MHEDIHHNILKDNTGNNQCLTGNGSIHNGASLLNTLLLFKIKFIKSLSDMGTCLGCNVKEIKWA